MQVYFEKAVKTILVIGAISCAVYGFSHKHTRSL